MSYERYREKVKQKFIKGRPNDSELYDSIDGNAFNLAMETAGESISMMDPGKNASSQNNDNSRLMNSFLNSPRVHVVDLAYVKPRYLRPKVDYSEREGSNQEEFSVTSKIYKGTLPTEIASPRNFLDELESEKHQLQTKIEDLNQKIGDKLRNRQT